MHRRQLSGRYRRPRLKTSMISGLIVYNSIDTVKNQFFIDEFLQKLNDEEISLSFLDEDFLLEYAKTHKIDFVIYRGRNYKMVEFLEQRNIKVFNNSLTNKIANDKYLTYEFLKENDLSFIETSKTAQSYPCIMKSVSGHGGQQVFLINNKSEQELILKEHPNLTFIYQDYLENNGDVRLYVLNKSVITSIKRDNPNDYRNNFSLGGNVSLFKPSKEMVESAIKIANLLNADFIGVDFLLTKDGFKIIEIEDPVGSRMVYKTTDIDIISLYIDYVRNNI